VYDEVRVLGIVCRKMHGKIVRAAHTLMHHEIAGGNCRAFSGTEDHRTDGQIGRSTTRQDLDIRLLAET
jgi:hypothetical protein